MRPPSSPRQIRFPPRARARLVLVPAAACLVAALAAHPARDVPLLLSASHDGTLKLWSTEAAGRGAPPALLDTFDGGAAMDYVTDAAWSPTHPAVFAAADLGGRVALFNVLLVGDGGSAAAGGGGGGNDSGNGGSGDATVATPVADFTGSASATRLRFAPDGARLAVGTLDAGVIILAVPAELAAPARADETALVAERYPGLRH